MPKYLISYDLHEGEDYRDLIDAIEKFDNWWHCLRSTWIVESRGNAKAIIDFLVPHITNAGVQSKDGKRGGDRLLVVKLQQPDMAWTTSFPDDCQAFLRNIT